MEKIRLEIVALSHSVAQSNNYAVVLSELNGSRRLPIVIGAVEAQSIAVAMERMVPNRPLTHDTFKNSLDKFDIDLKEIVINNLVEGVFYALLVCERHGEIIEIDSRTSDALAMAVRFQCPIYTHNQILEEAGVQMEDTEEEDIDVPSAPESRAASKTAISSADKLASYSIKDLNALLDEMLKNENYEKAAEIRDEISKREKES